MSDLGLAVPGSRGITASVNPNTGAPQFGVPGLRFVPSGFAGDANSSTVLFTSQRTVEGGYNVREAFAEFGIPLLKDGRLNLDEAIRGVWYTRQRQRAAVEERHLVPSHAEVQTASHGIRGRSCADAAGTLRVPTRRRERQRSGERRRAHHHGQLLGRKPGRRPRKRADQRVRLRVSAHGQVLGDVRQVRHQHRQCDQPAHGPGGGQRLLQLRRATTHRRCVST